MIKRNRKWASAYLVLVVLFLPIIAWARTEEWDEEALLHDGRTVEVHRKVVFHFKEKAELSQAFTQWPDEYSLKAKHPDTGEHIAWSGERDVNPIMLDFVDGIPYLVVMSFRVFSNVKLYGCPEIPFVFLRYEKQKSEWVPVSRHLAPRVLRTANLSRRYHGGYMRNGERQSKEFIARHYKAGESGVFTAAIPENYEEWDYRYKGQYRSTRYENDCRPPFPKPIDSINPKSPVPSSQNVALEILETKEFIPVLLIEAADGTTSAWSKLAWDVERVEACKAFLRPVDSDNPNFKGWQSFIKDTTGQKITAYSSNRLCDGNYIWGIDYVAERGRVVIIKLTPSGDVIYRISFERPVEIQGYMGHLMPPTINAADGYVYFEWWNTDQKGRNRHVKRAMKVRFLEPSRNS